MDGDPVLSPQGRLRLQGDWGGFNLTRTCGWLAQWVYDNTADHRRSLIYTGRGMGDSFRALAAGVVDVAVATPAPFARLAQQGLGPFEGAPIPELRALAVLPHRDAMIAVARADLGLSHLSDAAGHSGPLRISLGAGDRDGFMGFAGDMLLQAAGIDLAELTANGGVVTRYEQPFDSVADLREGRADVMISEAIMTPDWARLASDADVSFLALSGAEQQWIADRYGLGTLEVPAGYFPGVAEPLVVLDYAGWFIATTIDLPDDVAALLAHAVVSNTEPLARQYHHLPSERSPLAYPIDYREASKTPIALHPAAAEVYRDAESKGLSPR
ncbi:MAG: TAXI family TRAP transporter solute-binding subunit [Nakamurella sp.]